MDSTLEPRCQACGQHLLTVLPPALPTPDRSCGPRRRSTRLSTKPYVTLNAEPSSYNCLCFDCLSAVKLLATVVDLDDESVNDSSPQFTDNEADTGNNITLQNACAATSKYDHIQSNSTKNQLASLSGSHDLTTSVSARISAATRIVSPELSKNAPSITQISKLCHNCNVRAVPEEFMKYCKCCYAMSCKGIKMKPSNTNFEKPLKVGRCRLCTGAISNSSHQYCLKCYSAKQRDDAKRIQKDLYQKQFKKLHLQQPVQTVPYVCMDCGSTIHDCSWKSKCPPCFALSRTST